MLTIFFFSSRRRHTILQGDWSSDVCSSDLPQLRRPGPGLAAYLALLRLGVTVPRLLPGARWALTPPFHPYPWIKGGLFSVALSVASRRPGVTWQSALGSSDFPQHTTPSSMPRPSRPTATRQESYRFRKGEGKSSPVLLAHQPPEQAAQAVLRQTPAGGWPGGLVGGEPKPVTLVEDQLLDGRPVAGPERRRHEGYRVHEVEAACAV